MLIRFCTRTACGLALAIGCASAHAFDGPQRPFTLHWAGGNGPGNTTEPWRDWAGAVDFGALPVQRDIVVLYQSDTGLYPYAGIHQVEADPDWMRRHFIRLRTWVERNIPNPAFTGYAVIDYEQWAWNWADLGNVPSNQGPDARDLDFKDDWRDFMRASNPSALQGAGALNPEAVFERTYNDAVRRFMVATINECRRIRPQAKWGFYNNPPKSYYDYVYPDRTAAYRTKMARDLQWVADASDALFPDVYAMAFTVPSAPRHTSYEDSEAEHRAYVAGNIQTAIQMARGKPVIAFYWFRYHDSTGPFAYTFVSSLNINIALDVCKREGANGVALWEAFNNTATLNQYQQFVTASAVPVTLQYITDSTGNLASAGSQPPSTGTGGSGTTPPSTGGNTGGSSNSGSGGSGSSGNASGSSGSEPPEGNPLDSPFVNIRPTDSTGSNNNSDSTNRDEVNDRRNSRQDNANNAGNSGGSSNPGSGSGGGDGGNASGGSSDPNVSARTSNTHRDRSERRAAEIRRGNIVANAVANNGRQGRGAQRFSRPATVTGSSTTDGRRP